MNNQLQKVEMTSITEMSAIGKTFYESGIFTDIKSASQAVVKIMAGAELGIAPFASMSGIHIIAGKATIGAGLIAGRVKGSGKYDFKVTQQSATVCSIDFYQGKEKLGNSTFTAEMAKKAGTKNMDKFPENMLFARAISNGVKWFCPDVFTGPVYVPEEMQDVEYTEERTGDPKIFEQNTTLHNHKELGTPVKPLIPNKALKDACARLEKGELLAKDGSQLYDKLLDTYTFEATQRNTLDAAWQKGCVAADKLQEVVS